MSTETSGANVPVSPKSDEEILTGEQWAALDFEPWPRAADEWKPPADREWTDDGHYLLPFVRMAWFALHRTKAELVEGLGKLDDEPFETMMDGITSSSRTSPRSSRQGRLGFYALHPRQRSAPLTRRPPDD